MLAAYYPQSSHDPSMSSAHYQQPQPQHQPPLSTTSSFDHLAAPFDPNAADLSAYFEGLSSLQDNQMSRPTTQNPPIRIQQSTPSAANSRVATHKPMRSQSNLNGTARNNNSSNINNNNNNNNNNQNVGLLSPVHLQSHSYTNAGHERTSSGSSVTSGAPSSPHDHARSYGQLADPYSSPSAPENLENYSAPQTNYPMSLPTPVDTPVSYSFHDLNNYPTAHDAELNNISLAMRRQIFEQGAGGGDDDPGSYQNSVAQSVSSMSHNSPRTPMTTFPDEYDDGSKGMQSDFNFQVPMSRSMSGMRDELLMDSPSPTSAPSQLKTRQSLPKSSGLLNTHYRTVFNEHLQQAQQSHTAARSQSPSTSVSGERSPFRHGSEFATESVRQYVPQRSPQSRMTASQLRQEQKAGEDMEELAQHQQMSEEPKTISPKDAVYDYNQPPGEAAMPLFPPDQQMSQYNYSAPLALQQPMTSQPEQNYGNISAVRRESSNFSPQNYGFLPSQPQPSQGYGYSDSLLRQDEGMQSTSDRTPEFPAQLRAMETSMSEMTTPSGEAPQRPSDTAADAGTYSCTYHGCPQRFESPSKLQKHKREAHRQTTPSGMSMMSSRTSQAGPHKCTRINPSTGKPCNSEFSRPYDLTRHEDTIHNSRKMKVRCHFCQEEKTFSRNDALTRHMRVVHPDIDWPGKTRRKNARD